MCFRQCEYSDAHFAQQPKPDYVQNMKNPCWWVSKQTLPSGLKVNATFTRSLSCLPYFHIICCSKSGTTDLFHRIKLHPDIVPNTGTFGKELLFWSWAKYGQLLLLLAVVLGSFTIHGDRSLIHGNLWYSKKCVPSHWTFLLTISPGFKVSANQLF